jgi:hypothetical protein
MGLDMYLNARRYVSDWREADKELSTNLNQATDHIRNGMQVNGVEFEAMYWRKANSIHKWFVDNVQKGVDDCGTYDVTVPQLTALVETIQEVLKHKEKAKTLLPPQQGFFFGSNEFDDWYWQDLKKTHTRLTEIIAATGDNWDWSFQYHSSW